MQRQETCPRQHFDYGQSEIWCDKRSDKLLLRALQTASPFLSRIGRIEVLPSNSEISRSNRFDHVRPLLKYDRPDFLLFQGANPLLIVEMTEHGYTGDNSLQRFARLAAAGELGVPVIYFTPFSRTRVDEIESSERPASKRHVSANLFMGMRRIHEIHGTPMVALNWRLNAMGMPATVRIDASPSEKRAIFGGLLNCMEHIATRHCQDILTARGLSGCPGIRAATNALQTAANETFLRESEVKRSNIQFNRIAEIISNPASVIDLLGEGYFFKGKDHKLIALLCLQKSRIVSVENARGELVSFNETFDLGILPTQLTGRPSVIYFCGYEKRSEPNGGIIVNTDYLMCRSGPTVRDRTQNLVVIWPRVFYHSSSEIAGELTKELADTVSGSSGTELRDLLNRKISERGERPEAHRYIASTSSSIGFWNDGDTIGRICRDFCDLIVLNDAVLIGNHLKSARQSQQGRLDD